MGAWVESPDKDRLDDKEVSAMINTAHYPDNSATAIKLDKLIKITDKRFFHERLSSRMVKCASVLAPDEFLGWQMTVPRKGRITISVFGSKSLCKSDLEWIVEKTGKTAKASKQTEKSPDPFMSELYELFLPIADGGNTNAVIGFGNGSAGDSCKDFTAWPSSFSTQFEEMVRVFQNTGAIVRAVIGPASEDSRALCRKNTLRTYNLSGVDVNEIHWASSADPSSSQAAVRTVRQIARCF